MEKNLVPDDELRFILTSTVGHECILSYSDMGKILNALSYQNKGLYNHMRPFALQCVSHHNKLTSKK
jgi:hypothetical protein